MARIRTVKPEFWTDERIVDLSPFARLLFIGMWNFADDEGYLWDQPKTLKLKILPADDLDPAALIEELVTGGLLERMVDPEGKRALRIRGFQKHQKISHSLPSTIAPSVTSLEDSVSPPESPGTFAPEWNGRELNGMEEPLSSSSITRERDETDDAEGSTLYLKVKTELLKSFEEEDARAALTVWWPRQSTGEKFTSPLSFCSKVAATLAEARSWMRPESLDDAMAVIDGENFHYDHEDGHWHRVEAEVGAS